MTIAKMVRSHAWLGLIAASLFACGADGADEPENTKPGNAELGIAEFVVNEQSDRTTIQGFDTTGSVVADIQLVHGRFALTGMFREDYATPEVVGRKLDMTVFGKLWTFEVEGFTPTLQMPALPTWYLDAIAEDPHVKPVLAQWLIGFERPAALPGSVAGEAAYYQYNATVSGVFGAADCSSGSCGSYVRQSDQVTYGINMCGGDNNATDGAKVTRVFDEGPQIQVNMCCPGGTNWTGGTGWGQKQCPLEGTATPCGTVSAGAACRGCGSFVAWECETVVNGSDNFTLYWSET